MKLRGSEPTRKMSEAEQAVSLCVSYVLIPYFVMFFHDSRKFL